MKRNPFKLIWLILAFVCLGIGAAGVIIPVLPTTPFLLVASFCFARGSGRFHRWFLKTRLYQKHLESFVNNRSMQLKTKICILLPVTVMLMLAFFIMHNIPGRITIVALILFKYYYFIFRIKTIHENLKDKGKSVKAEVEYIK